MKGLGNKSGICCVLFYLCFIYCVLLLFSTSKESCSTTDIQVTPSFDILNSVCFVCLEFIFRTWYLIIQPKIPYHFSSMACKQGYFKIIRWCIMEDQMPIRSTGTLWRSNMVACFLSLAISFPLVKSWGVG